MKKIPVFLFAVALSSVALAAGSDLRITLSTKGEDTYADGTVVKAGEYYALVWVPAGSSGISIDAKGEITGGKIVAVVKSKEDGHCQKTLVMVSSDYKNGSWSILLLDTRRWSENGIELPEKIVKADDGSFSFVNVNAFGSAVSGTTVTGAKIMKGETATSASNESDIPEGTPQPQIVGISVKDGNAYVTVKKTKPYIQYDLSVGDTPAKVAEKANVLRGGADKEDDTVTFVTPVNETGSAFFKVSRR
ncbi:MAG: hypothetical protein IKE55_10255 [Kiritimatiellae bacterium]|nr:hypothetical protein [Kiritimatiellia bacterium]